MDNIKKQATLKIGKKNYPMRTKLAAVAEVEKGEPRWEVRAKYGMSEPALNAWLKIYGTPCEFAGLRPVITALQRRCAVDAIISGTSTMAQIQIKYKLRNVSSIKEWIKNFKAEKSDIVQINTVDMSKKNKAQTPLEEENERLQKALDHANLQLRGVNTLIDVAEQQLKISIRKKSGAKQ